MPVTERDIFIAELQQRRAKVAKMQEYAEAQYELGSVLPTVEAYDELQTLVKMGATKPMGQLVSEIRSCVEQIRALDHAIDVMTAEA
jgi:hypothetical protein